MYKCKEINLKVNLVSWALTIASWVMVFLTDYNKPVYKKRLMEFSLNTNIDVLDNMIEGAVSPIIMIFSGDLLGWLIIGTTVMGFMVLLDFNKKLGLFMVLSAMMISSYAINGFMIRPLYLVGTVLAPAAFATVAILTLGATLASGIKNILNKG